MFLFFKEKDTQKLYIHLLGNRTEYMKGYRRQENEHEEKCKKLINFYNITTKKNTCQ